jgi:putative glutamine amidotransferase
MRGANETRYREERDAVARDWWVFLKIALPGVVPLPLPNDREWSAALCRTTGLVGLLLTGGDDLGAFPERDAAEEAAFHAVRERGLPVLGICRGMQLLATLHGGTVAESDDSIHRARRHPISPTEDWVGPARDVNSYHGFAPLLAPDSDLVVSARAPDGSPEAVRHPELPVAGIHWHPERESTPDPHDLAIFRKLFGASEPR